MKTALVIGATGVTGQHIVNALLTSSAYEKVVVFSRRPLPIADEKLTCHCVDFNQIGDWSHLIQGDDLFSALGTTLKQAGSKASQYQVDYIYQADVIAAAKRNGVRRLFLISSPGADANAKLFYPRIKGELDHFAIAQNFETTTLFKPSIIEGHRPDKRTGEKVGLKVARVLCKLPVMQRFRPITGEQLGHAVVRCAERPLTQGIHTFELGEIFNL